MTARDDVHPLFFLSYARPGSSEPDRKVKTFFNDLSENVSELVSRRPGADPGFMDRSIRPGPVSRTRCTMSATRPSAKISSVPVPGTSPMSMPPSATWSSVLSAAPATPTSPAPAAITHATISASSPSTDTPEQAAARGHSARQTRQAPRSRPVQHDLPGHTEADGLVVRDQA
jgi:hypothetical protein